MPRKDYPNRVQAERAAEATARAFAADSGKAYPMPPDVYGPGRQPEPREAYYQRWYAAVREPDAANGRPQHSLDVDATMQAMNGRQVNITGNGGGRVTLDFTGLQAAAIGGADAGKVV